METLLQFNTQDKNQFMNEKPGLIVGGNHVDHRGALSFANDFNMDEVKRFYTIGHPDTATVRAWQGHKKEKKWFYVVSGSFHILVVKPDDWKTPSLDLDPDKFLLNEQSSEVLYVPAGYATGLKAAEINSKIIVFSDFTVEQSSNDNYRFDPELWCDWNKI